MHCRHPSLIFFSFSSFFLPLFFSLHSPSDFFHFFVFSFHFPSSRSFPSHSSCFFLSPPSSIILYYSFPVSSFSFSSFLLLVSTSYTRQFLPPPTPLIPLSSPPFCFLPSLYSRFIMICISLTSASHSTSLPSPPDARGKKASAVFTSARRKGNTPDDLTGCCATRNGMDNERQ